MKRNIFKALGIIAAVVLVIYGAHGLYAYFYHMEVMFSGGTKLFGAIAMPEQVVKYVVWMSDKGAQSWYIPGLSVAGGFFIWHLKSQL